MQEITSGAESEADGVGELIDAGLHSRPRFLVEGNILGISPHHEAVLGVLLLLPLPQLAGSAVLQSPLKRANNQLEAEKGEGKR